jgi:hypothetical protein
MSLHLIAFGHGKQGPYVDASAQEEVYLLNVLIDYVRTISRCAYLSGSATIVAHRLASAHILPF